MVADGQFVTGVQPAFQGSDSIDANAIGAAQVANDQIISHLSDATVTPRHLARVDLNVALGIPPDEEDSLIHHDARTGGKGHKVCGHTATPQGEDRKRHTTPNKYNSREIGTIAIC
jgi:hypothetical protein